VRIIRWSKARQRILPHGFGRTEIGRLRQISDGRGRVFENLTVHWLNQTGGDLEQGGFTRTIAADKGNAIFRRDDEVSTIQQRLSTEGQENAIKFEKWRCHNEKDARQWGQARLRSVLMAVQTDGVKPSVPSSSADHGHGAS
jgi:hypothetical protein